MSRRNGDRSRFNRVRKTRMHERARIRGLRKKLEGKDAGAGPKSAVAVHGAVAL